MAKYTVPDEKEREIISRNGIDPDTVAVSHRTQDAIYLLVHKTRDTIAIHRGDAPW